MDSSKIKCLIVDDEPISRQIIEEYIGQIDYLELRCSCQDPDEALLILQNESINILFSDIQMPKVNGLELVKFLANPPVIIFITAHCNFALDSYELNITDYLVKPVALNRFLKAVTKAKVLLSDSVNGGENVETANSYIFLKSDSKLSKFLIDDISYIEALKDYIKIFTSGTKPSIIHSSMRSIEEKLPSDKFLRIHKSCIVSLSHITSIGINTVELNNGVKLTLAKARKETLFRALNIKEGL